MNKSALMERAVHLALKGSFTTRENPNVGCLIYKDGMILSEGWHVTKEKTSILVSILRTCFSQ
jgi:diaminohydroxyphosphoribosylaminopyrimidine deaminase/5-amino-6-(5-phosphoribosylamino)uracil reductase